MRRMTHDDKALKKALQAAQEMSDVMDHFMATSFNRTMNLAAMSFLTVMAGIVVLPVMAATALGMGFTFAAKTLLVTAACCVGGGAVGISYGAITSSPSHKFSMATRTLRRVTNKLPENTKVLFLAFNKRANVLFSLAYAASAQERILDGQVERPVRHELEHEVELSLKKSLGASSIWSRIDFRRRTLPKATEFNRQFSALASRLNHDVTASIEDGNNRTYLKAIRKL